MASLQEELDACLCKGTGQLLRGGANGFAPVSSGVGTLVLVEDEEDEFKFWMSAYMDERPLWSGELTNQLNLQFLHHAQALGWTVNMNSTMVALRFAFGDVEEQMAFKRQVAMALHKSATQQRKAPGKADQNFLSAAHDYMEDDEPDEEPDAGFDTKFPPRTPNAMVGSFSSSESEEGTPSPRSGCS